MDIRLLPYIAAEKTIISGLNEAYVEKLNKKINICKNNSLMLARYILEDENISEVDEKVIKEIEATPAYDSVMKNLQALNEGNILRWLGALTVFPVWEAWRVITSQIDRAVFKCGTLRISNQRQLCINHFHLEGAKKALDLLNKEVKKVAKDDVKQTNAIINTIKKLEAKKTNLEEKKRKMENKYGEKYNGSHGM